MKRTLDISAEVQVMSKTGANKKCFDCGQGFTTYLACDFGIFLCSTCAGLHREFSHRVKGLSLSNFTVEEVENIKRWGNDNAGKLWLGKYDSRTNPVPGDARKRKLFIKRKYIDKEFYDSAAILQVSENDDEWTEFQSAVPADTCNSDEWSDFHFSEPPTSTRGSLTRDSSQESNGETIQNPQPSNNPFDLYFSLL